MRPGRKVWWTLGIFGFAAALYLPTLGHGLVWDDHAILMARQGLADWSRAGEHLTGAFFRESQEPEGFDYWRPLVVLSHMVERTLFGENAWGLHLINVLLHAVASSAVYLLARVWLGPGWPAVAAGLLFASHPVNVETVAWISGRSDLLCGLFLAVALLADRRAAAGRGVAWPAISLSAFAAALLAKESAAVFPLLVVASRLLGGQPGERATRAAARAARSALPSLALLAVYLPVRFAVIGVELPGTEVDWDERAVAFWTFWSAASLYYRLLVWPAGLTIAHQLAPAAGPLSAGVLAGLLATSGACVALWRLRRVAPGAAFGLSMLLLGLLPLTHFLVPISSHASGSFPLAERFLYAPSIGFCLFAGWLLGAWLPARLRRLGAGHEPRPARGWRVLPSLVWLLPVLVIAAAAARSLDRSADWRDEVALFESALAAAPESVTVRINLGAAYTDLAAAEGDPERRRALREAARTHYLEALRLAPNRYRLHFNLGNLHRAFGEAPQAEAAYRRALELNPSCHPAHLQLGVALVERGALREALAHFEAADRLQPRYVEAKVNRAHALQMLGRPEEAIPLYLQALELAPGLEAARSGLARARAAAGPGGSGL